MRSHLFNPAHADHYADAMRAGIDTLVDHLAGVDRPFSGRDVADVARAVDDIDLDRPVEDLDEALAELRRVYLDDAVWFHDTGYQAHLNCPVVIPALVAELFVSSVNSSLDTWDQSAGGTLIERRLIDWTAERIGFSTDPAASPDGVFTSGGTQSNLQALLMARGESFLGRHADAGQSYAEQLSHLRILASREAHFSVQKAATVLGLGSAAVVPVDVDARHRMDPIALERSLHQVLADGHVPMAVVATAGTTDLGAVDPLAAIADSCAEHGVWLHVDAAYGGGLLTSRRRRHLLEGIERADSVTVDYHKTFFQPVSSSAVLVRDTGVLRHVTYHADYLNPRTAELPNQVDKSMQTTRRFDALKLWTTLRVMGADAIGDGFDDVIDLAHHAADSIIASDDLELCAEPTLSTVVFRYRPDRIDAETADELNPRIRRTLWADGRSIVAGTTVDGQAWLKLTLLNPLTTLDDVDAVLTQVVDTGRVLLEHDLQGARR